MSSAACSAGPYSLGPLPFPFTYMNLPRIMHHSQIALFADDIAMHFSNADAVLVQANINSDLALLSQWAAANEQYTYLIVNPWF